MRCVRKHKKCHVLDHIKNIISHVGSIEHVVAAYLIVFTNVLKTIFLTPPKTECSIEGETYSRVYWNGEHKYCKAKHRSKMRNKNSIECVAKTRTILVCAYRAAIFSKFHKQEQSLLKKASTRPSLM